MTDGAAEAAAKMIDGGARLVISGGGIREIVRGVVPRRRVRRAAARAARAVDEFRSRAAAEALLGLIASKGSRS